MSSQMSRLPSFYMDELCVCPFIRCWISTLLLYLGYCKICYSLHEDAYIIGCAKLFLSCPTLCDPMDCSPARLLCLWDSPGKNSGVGCCTLFQGIFPTQGLNPYFLTTSAPWEAYITLSKDVLCLHKIPRSKTSVSYDSPIFNILRNLHIVFCSGCTTLHSHQHCTRVPFSSHASQRLLFVVFLTRAFLKDSFLTIPAEENGNAFQYSCQESSIDRRTWWAIVYGFTESNN